ncbi:uncharacterized protein METZ01_LOCUS262270, partial [marine metagenome]
MRLNSPKSIFCFFYKGLSKSLVLGIILSTIFTHHLYADVTHTAVVNGGNVVGSPKLYFNSTNTSITVTIIINDTGTPDETIYERGEANLLIEWEESGARPDPVDGNEGAWDASDKFSTASLSTFTNATATITFTASNINDGAINSGAEGDGHMLKVWLTSAHGDSANSKIVGPVTFAVGSTDYFVYDQTNPSG